MLNVTNEGFQIGDFRNVFNAMVLFDEMPTGTIGVDHSRLVFLTFTCGNHSAFCNAALLLLENVRYIGSKYDESIFVS